MKKSLLFLLVSAAAGAALIGGTFAAWAVTDNADPFSVKITPGTLDVGDTKSVTLEWGSKELINIEQLGMGEEKGPYKVGLKATTSDASAFTGSLEVKLETEATATEKLIDYLHVNVYDKVKTEAGAAVLLTVPDASENYTVKEDIVVTSGTVKDVYFYISLDSSIPPLVYNSIKSDIVTLTVDWNKGSAIEEVTSQTVYFNNTGSWSDVYVYAWKSADGAMNAAWPGVKMSQAKGAVYTAAIDVGFDKVIFNNGNDDQTDDLALPEVSANTPYYNGSAWVAAPDLSAESLYYLVGTMNEWQTDAAYLLTKDISKEGYTYSIKNVNIAANSDLKIVDPTTNTWYGENSTDGGSPNFHIGEANHYDFYFNPEGPTYIYCEAHV